MNRRVTARIAAVLLILHGLIEVTAPFTLKIMSSSLSGFGGLDHEQIPANIGAIAALGVLWGITRFTAAAGSWALKKWGLALGMAMCLVTMIAAVTVIPAGVADTLLATPVLALLLITWMGNRTLDQ